MTHTIPQNPVVLRREYLELARVVATRRPAETDLARPIALTQALLRDLTEEPSLTLRVQISASALKE